MITKDHPLFDLEARVAAELDAGGPMTGGELSARMEDASPIALWRVCYESNLFRVINCARYYLRYDILRDNQLRLSPSILRDFLTFSLVFQPSQRTQALEKSALLANKHRIISRNKIRIARQVILSIDEDTRQVLSDNACFFISGDVAYFLGHDVPRIHPEYETKINGSDIDILIIYNNHVDAELITSAEDQILNFKARALRDPNVGEEIDFLFKPVSKMFSQLAYRDIHDKIASKILYESFYLFGRMDLYERLLFELEVSGAKAKIEADFETALSERKETFRKIFELSPNSGKELDPEIESLFYFSQERLEFQ